jgi:hypothetical protein
MLTLDLDRKRDRAIFCAPAAKNPMLTGIFCARAATGHPAATPPTIPMNSRRLISYLAPSLKRNCIYYNER